MAVTEGTGQALSTEALVRSDTSPVSTADLDRFIAQINSWQETAILVRNLSLCSDAIGRYVQFRPEYHHLPVLIGRDNQAVPLYEFVEVVDGLVDYGAVQSELPTLSLSQVGGAIAFLRKVAQLNSAGIDIDDREEHEVVNNQESLDELRSAFADKEIVRVLNRS